MVSRRFNDWARGTAVGITANGTLLQPIFSYSTSTAPVVSIGTISDESTYYRWRLETPGEHTISGSYTNTNLSEFVEIYLEGRRIGQGKGIINFSDTGTWYDLSNPQESTSLVDNDGNLVYILPGATIPRHVLNQIGDIPLTARASGSRLPSAGFRRSRSGATSGSWTSPWFSVVGSFYPPSFQATLSFSGVAPTLEIRWAKTAAGVGASIWSTSQIAPAGMSHFQVRITMNAPATVRALSWVVDAEFEALPEDAEEGLTGTTPEGTGQSYRPRVTVLADGQDLSRYLVSVSQGSITLAGRHGQFGVPSLRHRHLNILLDGEMVDSGFVLDVNRFNHANGWKLELPYLRKGDLLGANPLDMSEGFFPEAYDPVDSGTYPANATSFDLPFEDEAGFLVWLAAHSPGSPRILVDTIRPLRDLGFWEAPGNYSNYPGDPFSGSGGLGYTPDEWIQFYGPSGEVGLDVLEQVANANLMTIKPLESGDLMLTDLCPVPDKTLEQIVSEGLTWQDYHEDGGLFVPDYRLYIPEVAASYSRVSPSVEVVGTSGPGQTQRARDPIQVYFKESTGSGTTLRKDARIDATLNFFKPFGTQTLEFFDSTGKPIVLEPGSVKWEVQWQENTNSVTFREIQGSITFDDLTTASGVVGLAVDVKPSTDPNDLAKQKIGASQAVSIGTLGVTGVNITPAKEELITAELRGRPSLAFLPKWLPSATSELAFARTSLGMEINETSNPFVVAITGYGSVDQFSLDQPDKVATYLTVQEALKARQVTLSYCGNPNWYPNQFLSVARRPPGGVGAAVTRRDIYLLMDAPSTSIEVGGEVRTTAAAAYLGTLATVDATLVVVSDDPATVDWYGG